VGKSVRIKLLGISADRSTTAPSFSALARNSWVMRPGEVLSKSKNPTTSRVFKTKSRPACISMASPLSRFKRSLGRLAALHKHQLAVGAGKGGGIAGGHKGLFVLNAGQKIGLPGVVQLAEHVVQKHHRVFAQDLAGHAGLDQLQAQHRAALLALAGIDPD